MFYLLRRSLRLPPCGSQHRGRTIHDILSSLRSRLHWQVYPTTAIEAPGPVDECLSRLSRRESYEEALKATYQRALETAEVLRSDIERLSWGMRDVTWTCLRSHSRSHSRSHLQSCSLDRWLRSHRRSQQFLRSKAGPSLGKIMLHPVPLNASPIMCSSQMNSLIRMCNSSLYS